MSTVVGQEAFCSNENTLNENNNSNLLTATLNTNTNSNQGNTTMTANTNTQTNTPTTVGAQTSTTSVVPNLNQVTSSKFNSYIEFENQFILRMPTIKAENGTIQSHPATLALREALASQNVRQQENEETSSGNGERKDPLKDRLFIDLNVDTRKGRVKFDNEIFEARLVDLPCIVESLKTTDKKTFYKSSDISQMLVCKTKDDPFSCDEDGPDESKDKKKNKAAASNDYNTGYINPLAKKYQWPHGITPPLKNVRRKRFRKAAKKKIIDYAEIEKEVKQLFRADREADQISFEIEYVEKTDTEEEEENLMRKINEENNEDNNKDDYDDDELSQDELSKAAYGDKNSHKEGTTESFSNINSGDLKSQRKSSKNNMGEESNMSFAGEDEASMMMDDSSLISNAVTKSKNGQENKSAEEKIENTISKSRTTFKNLFVDDVIGDLSSSSEEENENTEMNNSAEKDLKEDDLSDEESEDEDTNDEENRKLKKNIQHKQADVKNELFGDDSISNTSANQHNEEKDEDQQKEKSAPVNMDEDSMFNLDVKPASVSKQNEELANANLSEDMGDDNSLFTTSKTLISGEIRNVELDTKLNKLRDELRRIQEERKRKEIEINPINNPVLKARLTSLLNNLIEEERRKTEEIDEILSLLS